MTVGAGGRPAGGAGPTISLQRAVGEAEIDLYKYIIIFLVNGTHAGSMGLEFRSQPQALAQKKLSPRDLGLQLVGAGAWVWHQNPR